MDLQSPYPRCASASAFFAHQMQLFARAEPVFQAIVERLQYAGIDVLALVDHWILPASPDLMTDLEAWGFVAETIEGERIWAHPLARLPRVRMNAQALAPLPALAVDDVTLFLERNGLTASCREGDPDSAYEIAIVPLEASELHVVTRWGYRGFVPGRLTASERQTLSALRAAFRARPRSEDEAEVVRAIPPLFETAARAGGVGRAVDEFFAAERDFYLTRNAAARWQGARQQDVGIGWANHDHHTYRSSRAGFQPLMQLWQTMGFTFRERFYAGADAGWGAQIVEHPESRIVLFCDVDMAPEELDIDFATVPLVPRETLGTIGLWCALHGSSIAGAGMHHLECEFDFAQAEENFRAAGFGVMKPFTDLPILKQAFTAPEMWPVAPERLQSVAAQGAITGSQAAAFAREGAAGSHLEILQRWEGFKGFNKTGVSEIIRETDARRAVGIA